MPKFKAGDVVRVKMDATESSDTLCFPDGDLKSLRGNTVRILDVRVDELDGTLYYAEKGDNTWWFHEDWLEPFYVNRTITISTHDDVVVATVRYEDHTSKPVTRRAETGIDGFYSVAEKLVKDCKRQDELVHGPYRKYEVGDRVLVNWDLFKAPVECVITAVDNGPTKMPYFAMSENGPYWASESCSDNGENPYPYIMREVKKG